MEHSVYYFHSNIALKIFAFAKDEEIIKVYVTYVDDYNGEDETIDKFDFGMSFEELKSCKKLYEYYMLSKLLTENIEELTYSEDPSGQGGWPGQGGWRASFKKNWKGMYFTTEYYNDYKFDDYAENFMVDDAEKINSHKEHIERKEKDEPDYLTKYLETA